MNARVLLGVAVASAALAAACGDDASSLSAPPRRTMGPPIPSGGTTTNPTSTGSDLPVTDSAPAPDTAGKRYFVANIHPTFAQSCATCHEVGPGPMWISRSDAEGSYKMMFQLGYVALDSRILLKGPHQGHEGTSSEQAAKFTEWVRMELASGGTTAAPNVLAKLGSCFDRKLFDAIGLGDMRTVQRTADNNLNNVTPWNENADTCTGCNQAPCRTCHSGDDATLFVNAEGNNLLPDSYTFDESKKTSPAYLQKYFGMSASGEPIASNAIRIKAEATQKDKAYTHPMFRVSTELQTRMDSFVNDVITKYKAGLCGQ